MSDWVCKQVEHKLTEKEANLWWCGRKPSEFKCGICDKRFKAGDVVLSLFTNHKPDEDISGNPIVCASHGSVAECKDILKGFAKQAKELPSFIRRRYGLER